MDGLHTLHYAWTGWLKEFSPDLHVKPPPDLCSLWREDGFDPLSWRVKNNQLQLIVRMIHPKPPAFIAQRIKGRWQHMLREHADSFHGFKMLFW